MLGQSGQLDTPSAESVLHARGAHGEVVHENHRPILVEQLLKHQTPRANRNRSHEQRLEELWRLQPIAERVEDMRRCVQPGPPALPADGAVDLWWLVA